MVAQYLFTVLCDWLPQGLFVLNCMMGSKTLVGVLGASSRSLLRVLGFSSQTPLGVYWESSEPVPGVYSKSLESVLGVRGVCSQSRFSEFLGGAAQTSQNRFQWGFESRDPFRYRGRWPRTPATWPGRLILVTWPGRSIPVILCGEQHGDSGHNSWDHIFILWYVLPVVVCIAYNVC